MNTQQNKTQKELFEKIHHLSNRLNNLSGIIQNNFEYSFPTQNKLREFNEMYLTLMHDIELWKINVENLCKQTMRDNFNLK
jgi:hypothetical protein